MHKVSRSSINENFQIPDIHSLIETSNKNVKEYTVPLYKDVVSIGKIFLQIVDNSKKTQKENNKKPSDRAVTPMLHTIMYKHSNGYRCGCLELGFFSFDSRLEQARYKLNFEVKRYLSLIYFTTKNISQLLEDFSATYMEKFWVLYRLKSLENSLNSKLPKEIIDMNIIYQMIKEIQNSKEKTKNIENLKNKFQIMLNKNSLLEKENENLKEELSFLKEQRFFKQENLEYSVIK